MGLIAKDKDVNRLALPRQGPVCQNDLPDGFAIQAPLLVSRHSW
jgi:hypothetical protein